MLSLLFIVCSYVSQAFLNVVTTISTKRSICTVLIVLINSKYSPKIKLVMKLIIPRNAITAIKTKFKGKSVGWRMLRKKLKSNCSLFVISLVNVLILENARSSNVHANVQTFFIKEVSQAFRTEISGTSNGGC